MKDRDPEIEQYKKKSPAWDACTTTTGDGITRLARSLKSNDLAHFTDFYPRRALATNVRPTNGVNALISVPCRRSGRRRVRRDDEPFYRIRRRGLFRWGWFRRVLARRTNRLVWNHRTAQGGEIWGDDEEKIQARIEIKKTILFLAFSTFVYNLAHSESIPRYSIMRKKGKRFERFVWTQFDFNYWIVRKIFLVIFIFILQNIR